MSDTICNDNFPGVRIVNFKGQVCGLEVYTCSANTHFVDRKKKAALQARLAAQRNKAAKEAIKAKVLAQRLAYGEYLRAEGIRIKFNRGEYTNPRLLVMAQKRSSVMYKEARVTHSSPKNAEDRYRRDNRGQWPGLLFKSNGVWVAKR